MNEELRTKVKIALLATSITLCFSYNSFSFDDGDFQYWNTESVEWKIKEKYKIKLEEEFRFGDNAGTLYYQHSDIGLTWSGFADWLELNASYRQAFDIEKDKWHYENRPHLDATVKFDLLGLSLSDRSRVEYRNREHKDDDWRYRNKFTLSLPKATSYEIQPYVADEVFFDLDDGVFNRNRLYGGVSLRLFKYMKLELYYLLQTTKDKKDWINYNVVGTKLKAVF